MVEAAGAEIGHQRLEGTAAALPLGAAPVTDDVLVTVVVRLGHRRNVYHR